MYWCGVVLNGYMYLVLQNGSALVQFYPPFLLSSAMMLQCYGDDVWLYELYDVLLQWLCHRYPVFCYLNSVHWFHFKTGLIFMGPKGCYQWCFWMVLDDVKGFQLKNPRLWFIIKIQTQIHCHEDKITPFTWEWPVFLLWYERMATLSRVAFLASSYDLFILEVFIEGPDIQTKSTGR